MSFKTNHLLLLFFMVFIAYTNAQLELIVDFTSTISYSNYQCGDSNVFPPCTTLSDAGERARQYINSINTPTTNPSLTIKLRNGISNPTIIGANNELGNLFGYCSISVLVDLPTTTTYISIDGSLSNGPFISLEEPNTLNSNIQCTAGVSMNVKYLNLINWGENDLFFINVNQVNNPATNKAIMIQSVKVSNSSKVFIVQPKYLIAQYGSITLTFQQCLIQSLYSSTTSILPPFYLKGVSVTFKYFTTISNSVMSTSELIFVENGSLNVYYNFCISNVYIDANHPVVSTHNVGSNIMVTVGPWILNNCTFSTFLYQINTLPSTINNLDALHSLSFTNCNILTSTFASNSFIYLEQCYNDQSMVYAITDTSNQWNNNVIAPGKVFTYAKNIPTYGLYDIDTSSVISTSFQYPIVSHNSTIKLLWSYLSSNTPLIGTDSKLVFSYNNSIQLTTLNLCQRCIVYCDTTIVFDNTV